MKMEEILALCALIVAVIAAYFSYKSTIATKAAAISTRFDLILNWSCECIYTLLSLKEIAKQYQRDNDFDHSIYQSDLIKLSYLIEKGRFIFPNIKTEYGSHKVKSRQGLRPVILDFLVFAHDEAQKLEPESASKIDAYEQLFQSDIWEYLKESGYYYGVDALIKTKPIDLPWEHYIQSDLPNADILRKNLFH